MTSRGRLSALIATAVFAVVATGCGTVPPEVTPATGDRIDGNVASPAPSVGPEAEVAGTKTDAPDLPPIESRVPAYKPAMATIEVGQVAGPAILQSGATGDRVRDLQVRLRQLAWFSGSITGSYGTATTAAVRGFQDKRGLPVSGVVDQQTLDRLRGMTRTPTKDQLHNRTPKPSAAGLDPRCLRGRVLCISKSSNSLVWVIDGKAQARYDVRFGSYETPTREGRFSVGWKSQNHVSTIYHTPMPYAMFFSGGQAVHYSADFAARGYNGASHGCVNVRNYAGIQWLFGQVRVGDTVIVHR